MEWAWWVGFSLNRWRQGRMLNAGAFMHRMFAIARVFGHTGFCIDTKALGSSSKQLCICEL